VEKECRYCPGTFRRVVLFDGLKPGTSSAGVRAVFGCLGVLMDGDSADGEAMAAWARFLVGVLVGEGAGAANCWVKC
jgi:hypothetical protein